MYRFKIGQRVMIRAQQATGTVRWKGRQVGVGVNKYGVQVDPDQPLITINGLYTAYEHELESINDHNSGDSQHV